MSISIQAQNYVLEGKNWSDPSSWQGGEIPPNPFNGNSITIEAKNTNADVADLEIGSGATLAILSTASLLINGGTFTNNGTITVNGELQVSDGNSLENNGVLNIGDTFLNRGTCTNSATGVVTNEGNFDAAFGGGDVFINNGTINNEANATATSKGTFTNNGTLTNNPLASFTNDNDFTNGSTGMVENRGTFNTANNNMDNFTNQGTFENEFPGEVTHGGVFLNTGTYANKADAITTNTRTFTSLPGGIVDNDGNFVNVGTGSINNDGTFNNNVVGNLSSDGNITNEGIFNNIGTLTSTDDILNTEEFNNNGTLVNSGTGIFNNDNTFNNQAQGAVDNDGVFVNTMMSSVLNNDNVFDGGDMGDGTITNFGTINNNGTLSSDGKINNNAIINNTATGTVSISNDIDNNSTGTITNDHQFSVGVGGSDNNLSQNLGTIINNGELSNSGRFINTGTIENKPGADISTSTQRLLNRGLLKNNGTVTRNSGVLQQDDANGVLSGTGSFELNGGELEVTAGTLAPGNSFGTMTITGDLSLSGMTFLVEIGGDGSSDLIEVSGDATISGTVEVIFGPGLFNDGETWDILTAGGTLTGSFTDPPTFTLPDGVGDMMPSGLTVSSNFTTNVVFLTYTGEEFLPVQLNSFSGKAIDNTIELNWSTAQELNNNYMAVERSADGLSFQEIGRVAGQGTTQQTQHYSFIDDQPLDGFNYYRLRQVDFDGTEHFSNVIVINMEIEIDGIEVQLYPNPSSERIFLNWRSNSTSEGGWVRLIETASGKEIKRQALPEGTNQMEIPVSELPTGHYVIQLMQGGRQKAVPFVKN